MRPTVRGVQLLVLGTVLYGVGVALGHPLLRAIAGVCLGAVVAGMLSVTGRLRLRVDREVFPERVPCGEPALARLVLRNDGGRRIGGLTAADRLAGGVIDVPVGDLAGGGTVVRTYELPTSRRGRLDVGPLTVGRNDPLGLAASRQSLGGSVTLRVHPRVHAARAAMEGSGRAYAGVDTGRGGRGSMEFRSVREYVVGDEPRHLHWKSTARTGQLMVRELVDPVQPGLAVLLDTRAGAGDPEAFEQAVEVAASLVRASADAGHAVRLRTTGGLDLRTDGGTAGGRDLLDALAEVARDDVDLPVPRDAFDRAVGCLVYVSAGAGPDDLRVVAAARSRAESVVAIVLGAEDGPAGPVLTIRAPDAATAVRRWNAVSS